MGQNLVKESAELVSDSGTKGHSPSLVGDVQVAEVVKVTLVLSVSNMSLISISCISLKTHLTCKKWSLQVTWTTRE